jgi:hypothetical protein
MNLPFLKTYTIKCPDGSTRTVYKNIDKAFPLYIPGWNGKFNANIEALKGAPVNLNADYQSKIQGLLYSLDDLNQNLMISFRAVYVSFQSNPCKNSDSFDRQIETMIQEHGRLTRLKIQIRGLIELAEMNPNNQSQFLPVFNNIVHQIGGQNIQTVATIEINDARTEIKTLQRGGNNVG